jgi:hypothetical protein
MDDTSQNHLVIKKLSFRYGCGTTAVELKVPMFIGSSVLLLPQQASPKRY